MGKAVKKWAPMVFDPGGVFYTSKDPQIAKMQGRADLLGFGAKAKIAERASDAAQAKQEGVLNEQKAEADALLAERKKRMVGRQTGRGSLLSGTESGVSADLSKTLG